MMGALDGRAVVVTAKHPTATDIAHPPRMKTSTGSQLNPPGYGCRRERGAADRCGILTRQKSEDSNVGDVIRKMSDLEKVYDNIKLVRSAGKDVQR